MKEINIGLVGLGTIGGGVYSILESTKDLIYRRRGIKINVTKVADKDISKIKSFGIDKNIFTTNADDIINDPNIHIVVELVGGTTFAYDLIESALKKGKHVTTANKALLAYKGRDLFRLANNNKLEIGFEASVGGGIPIIMTIKEALVGDRIKSIYGIVNGTTNYILTKMMDENKNFSDSLNEAKELGFAEADPTLDLNGGDAAHKMAILASFAFNTEVPYESVHKEGIENIELVDISYAKELGYTLKLLGVASNTKENKITVAVHPTLIPTQSTLANIKNEVNAILLNSDFLTESIYVGKGAGRYPTANAVVGDIVHIAEHTAYNFEFNDNRNIHYEKKQILSINESSFEYYLRFNTLDKPGILAKIAGIFADNNISIARVIQKGHHKDRFVHLVLKTHKAYEADIINAISKIDLLDIVDPPSKMFRIVNL